MLRLFTGKGFYELRKCSYPVLSCVTKRKASSFLPVSSTCPHRLHVPARLFSTGRPVWKDASQPQKDESEDIQTMDLNKWKSVMRSQAAAAEQKEVKEEEGEESDEENCKEPGRDLKDGSHLAATREMVVMWRQAGKLVPQEITDEEVQTLAELATKTSKKNYLKHLAIKEHRKGATKEKRQKKWEEKKASLEASTGTHSDAEEGDDQRGPVMKNTFLLRYWHRSLDKLLAWRTAQSMLFGQPLVFDMSYESNMGRREIENTVHQLMEAEGWNRRATEPFHLHFCNLQPDMAYEKELLKRYGAETWARLCVTATDRQHVDLFPREQLVYLTADSPNVLRKFDHSKVYIIGSMVDRSIQKGLSLANAKRLKLATARLPLDQFLRWEIGAKNLTLDQMIRIMLTIKETGKWEEALKFVPMRKHAGFHQQRAQEEISKPREVTHRRPRADDSRWLISSGECTFKNEAQSLYRSPKQPGFTSRDRTGGLPSDRENKPTTTRVSFKNKMEGRKGTHKSWTRGDDK
ncbi:tRNA methyltransferase 10 homolog C [Morone saxatilis]|uniref:tRNA methyltransferase 10 homolog C n=1 Tax=Morone saxatilis TaxID=34816 RepID=UPI0015E1EB1E|nr:tRNA methyltransferase 10 homolog C [Morone saxatilis]